MVVSLARARCASHIPAMDQTPDSDALDRAADAALALAAELGWERLTLAQIAQRAGLPMDALYGRATSKADVLDVLARRFDRAAAATYHPELDETVRERVFDAAMARFDAMEPHRAGLVAIMERVDRDPALAARAWRSTVDTARWLLELADVDTAGPAGFARVRVFAAVLVRTTRAWMRDDSGDQARTMARLDRQLRDISGFANAMRRRWRRDRRNEAAVDPDGPPPIRPRDGQRGDQRGDRSDAEAPAG